jgi:putative hydrolase of the HAD superfamily
MIKTVIFDIGNVLADFSWEPFFKSFGFTEEVFLKLADATVKSPEWDELDRGVWTTEEIIQAFIKNDPEVETEIRLLFQDLNAMVTKRDYAITWIKHLKDQGFQVLYLSNFGELTRVHCQDALSFMPYTDGGIMSYEVKMIKPDPAIYQALIDKYLNQ